MAVLKPRNRLVYFRVSEDEFQQFMQFCEREGTRSISDLAREAMHRVLAGSNGHSQADNLAPQVKILETLIAEVSAQLHQLATLQGHEASSIVERNGAEQAALPCRTEQSRVAKGGE